MNSVVHCRELPTNVECPLRHIYELGTWLVTQCCHSPHAERTAPRTRMLATTADFLKESGQVFLIMTGPPLRCHPCRLPANHFLRKSHSLRRIYARGNSPFLLGTFRLSVDTGDRNKLLCILKPRYGALRTIFDN